jgi:glucan endo-1,3-beta-D-glucosidase
VHTSKRDVEDFEATNKTCVDSTLLDCVFSYTHKYHCFLSVPLISTVGSTIQSLFILYIRFLLPLHCVKMLVSNILAIAAFLSTTSAQYKGFNYGSTNTDQSPKTLERFQDEFAAAQGLIGASGFNSARLYTMIQAGTANTPISAIQAAINTRTSLLLGMWASAGQANIDNEIAALNSAIAQYGTAFTDLIVAISVGSEDLYRISPTGVINKSGAGAEPNEVASYINQVRGVFNGAGINKPVGHVDTWTAWVNGSNSAVIEASDFLGMDGYPYFQVRHSVSTLMEE